MLTPVWVVVVDGRAVARCECGWGEEGQGMKIRLLLFDALSALVGSQAHADDWFSDNVVGLRWGGFFANPGAPSDAARNVNRAILNASHFDVWKYGSNFGNVDILFSNANEPNRSGGGSTEVYAVYRGQLSPDKIFGLNTSYGPIQAINLEFGGDAETENTEFAPNKKVLVLGPNFHFNMPAGFMNLGVHMYVECQRHRRQKCQFRPGAGI
ncbi:MAG: hypothetical protein ACJ8AW_47960 [Rhodopila sp.]